MTVAVLQNNSDRLICCIPSGTCDKVDCKRCADKAEKKTKPASSKLTQVVVHISTEMVVYPCVMLSSARGTKHNKQLLQRRKQKKTILRNTIRRE